MLYFNVISRSILNLLLASLSLAFLLQIRIWKQEDSSSVEYNTSEYVFR